MSPEAIHQQMRSEQNGLPLELLEVRQIKAYMGRLSKNNKDQSEEDTPNIVEISASLDY